MRRTDAIVVGGGPAGSTCAWKLRQAGLDVLVLDKAAFPRLKLCAGWVTPACLRDLELTPEDVAALDQRTEGWIAGLQMAAHALQGTRSEQGQDSTEISAFIAALSI